MINRNNVYLHEWIGASATVTGSCNANEIGVAGELCDETKNTLVILTVKGEKRIVKKGRTFDLRIDGSTFTLNGTYAAFRPEDRIKERRRIFKMMRNGE